jgi:hypothetical protein
MHFVDDTTRLNLRLLGYQIAQASIFGAKTLEDSPWNF